MTDNRRSSFRHVVDLTIQVTAPGQDQATTEHLTNLSMGGAFIDPYKLAMGQRVHVIFSVPTQAQPIDTPATVRWTTDEGIGIQFDGLRARDVWALSKYFEQLDK